jgi:hypothetical protein
MLGITIAAFMAGFIFGMIVWCIKTHVDSSYDYMVVRAWPEVLDYIRDIAESKLDDELPTRKEPFVMKVWVEKMTLREYEESGKE